MSVIVKLLSKFDDSGIKKAQHGFGGLKKTLGAIGIGFGIKAIADGLMDAAKAASADQKSTALLNTQLTKNLGLNKQQIKGSDKFIEKLSLQTGILDDNLRPVYARFANVTHNVTKAQKLLTMTVDASAGSGLSQARIAKAVAKAYDGNTKSLIAMFPELKNSKNALADFSKEYSGMAALKADPFMKFNNSMDILKEKLGGLILPIITKFIDSISQPGGMIDQIGAFFDAASNPKSDVGKAFKSLGDSATILGEDLTALFGTMDPNNEGNSMAGFAHGLQMLADLIGSVADGATVLGGILQATFSGDFMKAIELSGADFGVAAYALRKNIGVQDAIKQINANTLKTGQGSFIQGSGFFDMETGLSARNYSNVNFGGHPKKMASLFGQKAPLNPYNLPNTQVNITVTSADPKAVVDAVSKYVKSNGNVPSSWGVTSSYGTGGRR